MTVMDKAISEFFAGDWVNLSKTAENLLQSDKANPIPKFFLLISYPLINPPKLIESFKFAKELVDKQNLQLVVDWTKQLENHTDSNTAYFRGATAFFCLQKMQKNRSLH